MNRLAFAFLLLSLVACKHKPKPGFSAIRVDVSALPPAANPLADSLKAEQLAYRQQEIRDSIDAERMLTEMLALAKANIHQTRFSKTVAVDSNRVYSSVQIGHLFSKDKRHLFIKRVLQPHILYIDLYLIEKNGFKNVLSFNEAAMDYIADTVRDVNGDDSKDFLYHWYPSSGCCRRNAFDVYLYNKATGGFNRKINFVNPTFYPAEKLIRGVAYGHSGEVPLYKYRWNGDKIDTVEYIYPADTLQKKFYKVHHWRDLGDLAKRQELKAIPAEYRHIASID